MINNGNINMINQLGHANPFICMKLGVPGYTSYGAYPVTKLRNDEFVIGYFQGCWTTAFDFGGFTLDDNYPFKNSISEWMTVKMDSAEVIHIGNSHFGWGTFGSTDGPSQCFHREFIDAIFEEGKTHIGEAQFDSKEDNAGRVNSDDFPYRWVYYCNNLLGDPLLELKCTQS